MNDIWYKALDSVADGAIFLFWAAIGLAIFLVLSIIVLRWRRRALKKQMEELEKARPHAPLNAEQEAALLKNSAGEAAVLVEDYRVQLSAKERELKEKDTAVKDLLVELENIKAQAGEQAVASSEGRATTAPPQKNMGLLFIGLVIGVLIGAILLVTYYLLIYSAD